MAKYLAMRTALENGGPTAASSEFHLSCCIVGYSSFLCRMIKLFLFTSKTVNSASLFMLYGDSLAVTNLQLLL
jgi:hypothetical protein